MIPQILRFQIIFVLVCIMLYLLFRHRRNRQARQHWVHPVNQTRDETGVYAQRIVPLRQYPDRFFGYFRMHPVNFDYLLNLIRPDITKQETFMRKPIAPELKLAVTLHHLAEGSSHRSIAIHYALGRSTISNIIYETCEALCKKLQPLHMPVPTSHQQWRVIAQKYVNFIGFI